ncbi:hypothetical protein ABIE26_002846 [Pedobacter africanus]|uniref:Uncharacterized protein n=1 Tax=Pedobacter africanus TaxID=151894 RepID=A0ACC6KX87_9SPHI|nr:hypothetical protein [Pedobacter africanus]MDR6783765.1 hypothetical protein [Pedobacter africanus]
MNRFTMENKDAKIYLGNYRGKISTKVKDHPNDLYLSRKAEEAWKTLEKVGLPEELLKIRTERMKK